jgi:hypothetical protein
MPEAKARTDQFFTRKPYETAARKLCLAGGHEGAPE